MVLTSKKQKHTTITNLLMTGKYIVLLYTEHKLKPTINTLHERHAEMWALKSVWWLAEKYLWNVMFGNLLHSQYCVSFMSKYSKQAFLCKMILLCVASLSKFSDSWQSWCRTTYEVHKHWAFPESLLHKYYQFSGSIYKEECYTCYFYNVNMAVTGTFD